jgi:hypothetical protein
MLMQGSAFSKGTLMARNVIVFFLFSIMVGSTVARADISACAATIEGAVYQDANQNGDRDPGEVGMGAIVRIYSDTWGGPLAEVQTGALMAGQGKYVFPIVQTAKTYYVCVSLDSCSTQTQPAAPGPHVVQNVGPHGPESGTPDEGAYCWAVEDPFNNRRFGVYTRPCE